MKLFGKKIVRAFEIEPYHQECVLVVNGHFADAYDFIKKLKTLSAKEIVKHIEENKSSYLVKKERTESCLYTDLPYGYVMLVDHQDSWISTVGNIVHESVHLSHYVLHRAGLTLSKDSEEAFTYLAENITEKILEIMYPPKKK